MSALYVILGIVVSCLAYGEFQLIILKQISEYRLIGTILFIKAALSHTTKLTVVNTDIIFLRYIPFFIHLY